MAYIIHPKNWNEFQHYKDRSPIWIKLHKRLLDDFEFQSLPVASRALAPMLWLIASEYDDGDIPGDVRKIAFRLRMSLEDLSLGFEPLKRRGFFEIIGDDSAPLAEPERDAIPEKEIQVTSNKTQVTSVEEPARDARSPSKRKTQIPENFPSKAEVQAAAKFWTEQGRTDLCATVVMEAAQFRDRCVGDGVTALDWSAKWRTWYRNTMRFNKQQRPSGRKESQHEQRARIIAEDHASEAQHRDPPANQSEDHRLGVVLPYRANDGR